MIILIVGNKAKFSIKKEAPSKKGLFIFSKLMVVVIEAVLKVDFDRVPAPRLF